MTLTRHKPNHRMSQAVRAGDMVYLAGQIPDQRDAGIEEQTAETLAKIDALLDELGGSKSDLVSVQIWLHHMDDFAGMNTAWDAWVDPQNPPARATGGAALASAPSGVRIEIISVAYLPAD
ncbi:RidA family protein [Leisingera thetidis]|uniref:RidA family protein n=1 Tax=Leisingera thetidis TaxID=2930199 RepID=UPI0021F74765|nr:RidA family protein [Leisingera thetidis]